MAWADATSWGDAAVAPGQVVGRSRSARPSPPSSAPPDGEGEGGGQGRGQAGVVVVLVDGEEGVALPEEALPYRRHPSAGGGR